MTKTALTSVVATIIVALTIGAGVAIAGPPAWTVGDAYRTGKRVGSDLDGPIDTRLSAAALARALAKMGYNAHAALHGLTHSQVLPVQTSAAVFAVFGHGNAGTMTTKFLHPGPDFRDYALLTAARPVYSSPSLRAWENAHVASWAQLPQWGSDRTRVAILGGCRTALNGIRTGTGSFFDWGRWLGIDAIVGFRGLTASPVKNTNYAGNYFWSRFAVWIQRGATLGRALARARIDIVRHEGRDFAWGSWAISGAAPHPNLIRLRSARFGERDQPPLKARDRSGALIMLDRDATRHGIVRLSTNRSVATATRFLAVQTAWHSLRPVSVTNTSHLPGESLVDVVYRSRVRGIQGPAVAEVEVDRHTGAVVFETAGAAHPSSTHFRLRRAGALRIARRASPAPWPVISAYRDIWKRPRWNVVLAPAATSARRIEVQIDGDTGRVLSVLST